MIKSFAINRLLFCFLVVALPVDSYGVTTNQDTTTDIAPEAPSSINPIQIGSGHQFMAVTANPYASAAAKEILQLGGSAVDAAIAAQLVLGLVEPQSSGIGGGAFMLFWSAGEKRLHSYDGRETAPKTMTEDHFLTAEKKPMNFFDAVIGGHAVGTPGLISMLELAHREHGTLAWQQLFTPAIKLSEEGFIVSPRLHKLLSWLKTQPKGVRHEVFIRYFYDAKGKAIKEGIRLKNPAYAKTLKLLAKYKAKAFYQGELAQQIVNAVQTDLIHPGKLSKEDLQSYSVIKNTALCKIIFEFKICAAPPPSSGGFTVLSLLALLEQKHISPSTSELDFIHLFSEASKLAFADRNTYLADPAFVDMPITELLSTNYLQSRAQLIDPIQSMGTAKAGKPKQNSKSQSWITAQSPELPSTSHLSIIDSKGNIVSMTSSIEMAFGSRIMVAGFLLNNQLTDFSFRPSNDFDDGNSSKVANRVEPGKRPRSSMAPTIVFNAKDQPVLVLGSPGGSRIIDYVAKTLAQTLAMGKPLVDAISGPHIVHLNKALELEADRGQEQWLLALELRGHEVQFKAHTSGLHAISIGYDSDTVNHKTAYGLGIDKVLTGIADQRREGSVSSQ